jgi:exodeoxyribonuclease V alpha subunit
VTVIGPTVVAERGLGIASRATGLLRSFNDAGVLVAADVQVAKCLTRLAGSEDELVSLAAALAVRAPRLGHTCVDLGSIRETADADVDAPTDIAALPWPESPTWTVRLEASSIVGEDLPLRLEGTRLYLDRYWSDECLVAEKLLERASFGAEGVDLAALEDGIRRLLGGGTDAMQRLAATSAVLRKFVVVAGGPGTGKTTTVARILALLDEQATANSAPLPLVGLAAPTGKAAARLEEAVREESATLDTAEVVRQHLSGLHGLTLHRLLGSLPGSSTRFRHDRSNPLPHDVVIVDETSMVPLSMMARLSEAVRADARIVLVGDPQQLASVEAGAVLGDVVGPAATGMRMRSRARSTLAEVTGVEVPASEPPLLADATETPIGDGIVVLNRVHRFGAAIARLADAVRRGDSEAALGVLHAGDARIHWIDDDVSVESERADARAAALSPVRSEAVEAIGRVFLAAACGEAEAAIEALGSFRLLCAHRHGPAGAVTWAGRIESWVASDITGNVADGTWYVGRPLLVTANDYGLRLYNGDTGVVVNDRTGRRMAAFERGGDVVLVSPSQLEAVETVYAMTVHKSQGSQFDQVAMILPRPDSPVLTRELLYTAITRARERVTIVGSRESLVAAIGRPIARSSGLGQRLWGL